MTTDIHELYAEKQKQYQDYLVEKRVHEQNLKSALDALNSCIAELRPFFESDTSSISTQVLETLNKCSNAEEMSAEELDAVVTTLGEISKNLEEQIREALQ